MSHDVKELIEGLNEDLAGEYSAIIIILVLRRCQRPYISVHNFGKKLRL
ncbi:Ferritin Dps family protein [Bacillus cereus]|nr:Ferritin Dps family protein [Bacillus cereus]